MGTGIGVEGDIGSAGLGKHADQFIHGLDHEVDVDGRGNSVGSQGLADHRPDGEVGHVVIVHHIKVDHVRTGSQHGINLFTQTREVRRKYGWGYLIIGHKGSWSAAERQVYPQRPLRRELNREVASMNNHIGTGAG